MYCLTGLEAGGGPWENAQNMNCEINPSWVGRELGYLSTNSQESLLQGCSLGLSPLRQRDAGAGTCWNGKSKGEVGIRWSILHPKNLHVVVVAFAVARSCPTFRNPMDYSPPVSSVHEISQAKIPEWVAISSSRESSQPRDWTCVSCIGRQVLYHWATRDALRIQVIPSKLGWLASWYGRILDKDCCMRCLRWDSLCQTPTWAMELRCVLRALASAVSPGLTQDWPHFTVLAIAAAIPLLMPFTVNFTITNLHYTEDLGNSDSQIFKATERDLQLLVRDPHQGPPCLDLPTNTLLSVPSHSSPSHSFQLRPLFRNSSIGSQYAGCRLTLLRWDVFQNHFPGN